MSETVSTRRREAGASDRRILKAPNEFVHGKPRMQGCRWFLRSSLAAVSVALAAVAAAGCAGGSQETVTVTVQTAQPTDQSDVESQQDRPSAQGETGPVAPPPLTRSEYQTLLDRVSAQIANRVNRVFSSPTWKGLLRRSDQARDAVNRAVRDLDRMTPPPGAERAHETLVRALNALAAGLSKTIEAELSRSICAAPAAQVRVGNLDAARSLRAARQGLRANGYQFPGLLPKRRGVMNRSLPTGTYLVDTGRGGTGELRIENGRVVDGVVVMLHQGSKRPAIALYVGAKETATITGIPDGTYVVSFTYGKDWDESRSRFTRNCDFSRFDKPFPFTTEYQSGGYTYSIWEISLQPVKEGTASTSPVEPDNFPRLTRT